MSDIENKLRAWGAWASDNKVGLNCKSPSLMLIKSAPHQCKDSVKGSKHSVAPFITDEDALIVDRAMGDLMRHSVHLYAIVYLHFVKDWAVHRIATDYWSDFEYPCKSKKATTYHVKPLLSEGIGVIQGLMIKAAC